MKTATPPKGVTARWVSRRITRSPESRAVISCGTGLSEEFASTLLYRKHLHAEYSSASEFRLNARGFTPSLHFPRASSLLASQSASERYTSGNGDLSQFHIDSFAVLDDLRDEPCAVANDLHLQLLTDSTDGDVEDGAEGVDISQ